jgi:putative ABC transport system permease protein
MTVAGLFDTLRLDVRFAARSLRATPAFTAVVLATLAIGIGATTAIFSTVNAVLLRPLPYLRAGELVSVKTRYVDGRATTGLVSGVELQALRNLHVIVERAAGFQSEPFSVALLRGGAPPVSVAVSMVTDDFFEIVGLPMIRGRGITRDEQVAGPNGPIVAVLSYRAWNSLFSTDAGIVGTTIHVAEFPAPVTIVGVAPPVLALPKDVDFWINARVPADDQSHFITAVVQLRRGATIQQLRGAAGPAMLELGRVVPNDSGREYVMRSLVSSVVGDLGPVLLIVLGATALLLLLACVNVTNLLLARGMARTREMAVRAAVGASRGRVVRQLRIESMVVSAGGSMAGLLIAYAAVRLLIVLGASKLPRLDTVPLDGRVLLFAFAVLLFCGVAMGIAPAWQVSRANIKSLLNSGGRTATSRLATSRVMSGMVVVEVALAIALVAGAGWLVQSFARLRSTDPGFSTHGRLVVDVRPIRTFSQPSDVRTWTDDLLRHVRRVTPHATVGLTALFPLRNAVDGTTNVEVAGEAPDPDHLSTSHQGWVTPELFAAMGTKLVAGRMFTDDDRAETARVTIVNRAFVRLFITNGHPLTASIFYGFPTTNRKEPLRIIGVVEDVKYTSLLENAEPAFYVPQAQNPATYVRPCVVIAAPGGVTDALIGAVRDELRRFDPQLIVAFTPADTIMAEALSRQEFGMRLMLIFGATALTLAAIGIYGVIAYVAAQRRGELATRIALGASARQVFWLMMGAGQKVAVVGVVIGVAAAYIAGRLVASSVYAMRASDPLVLFTAGGVVALVTFAATMVPAIKASRVDPVQALRPE